MKRGLEPFLAPAVACVLGLALWEGAVRLLRIPAYLLPPPSAVVRSVLRERALLASALYTTTEGALCGFALSLAVGTLAGILLSLSRVLERGLYPYTIFLQTVPIVAIAPLLVLWFGVGLRAVAVSAFIVSVFPVVANTLSGLKRVDPRLVDLFHLHGASRLDTLVKLRLPSAVVSMTTGWRVAAGLAVIGTIVGEFVAGFSEGSAGLGITILAAYRQLRTDLLFGAVLLAALLGLGLFAGVSAAARLLLQRFHARG
jgi:NitT/TauT family transport system permease protein